MIRRRYYQNNVALSFYIVVKRETNSNGEQRAKKAEKEKIEDTRNKLE